MISVIVPVYKVERYLRSCVDSIRNQVYGDLEIVLIDDGSPDRSGKICDELMIEDDRISVIHQKNGGLAAARNAGLEFVMSRCISIKNHYIAFVDSDDTIDKNMYQIMINLANKNEADIVICGHQSVASDKDRKPCVIERDKPTTMTYDMLWNEVFGRLNNSVWNKLYRADLIGDLRFPIGITHGEDLVFNLQYLRKCSTGIKSTCKFYHYYRRAGSITRSGFSENKLYEIVAKDEAKQIVGKFYPTLTAVADKYCFRARMNVLRSIYASGKEEEYADKVSEYSMFVRQKYKYVRHSLKVKEKMEYYFFVYCNLVYIKFTRRQ